jgi:hypothetical protein
MIQDHLRFASILALGRLALLDQVLGVEPGVGVTLQPARRPG